MIRDLATLYFVANPLLLLLSEHHSALDLSLQWHFTVSISIYEAALITHVCDGAGLSGGWPYHHCRRNPACTQGKALDPLSLASKLFVWF